MVCHSLCLVYNVHSTQFEWSYQMTTNLIVVKNDNTKTQESEWIVFMQSKKWSSVFWKCMLSKQRFCGNKKNKLTQKQQPQHRQLSTISSNLTAWFRWFCLFHTHNTYQQVYTSEPLVIFLCLTHIHIPFARLVDMCECYAYHNHKNRNLIIISHTSTIAIFCTI